MSDLFSSVAVEVRDGSITSLRFDLARYRDGRDAGISACGGATSDHGVVDFIGGVISHVCKTGGSVDGVEDGRYAQVDFGRIVERAVGCGSKGADASRVVGQNSLEGGVCGDTTIRPGECVSHDAGVVGTRVGVLGAVRGSSCGRSVSVTGGIPRGPNYARNQEARMRKRVQKEERKLAEAEARGRREGAMESRGGPSESWRGGVTPGRAAVVRSEKEQKLHELKVERQIIQEERKLKKLLSPVQMIEDAMRQVAFAEKCAKMANNNKVAGWAATIATASSESIARSAPSTVPSYDNLGSKKKAETDSIAKYTIAAMEPNAVEVAAVGARVLNHSELVEARFKLGRALGRQDFLKRSAFRLTYTQREEICEAAHKMMGY